MDKPIQSISALTKSSRKDRENWWFEGAEEMKSATDLGEGGRLFTLLHNTDGR